MSGGFKSEVQPVDYAAVTGRGSNLGNTLTPFQGEY